MMRQYITEILKLSPSVYLNINQWIEEDFGYIGENIAIHRRKSAKNLIS